MDENKNIELRSEKVRNIIGQVPSVLLRYGTFIIGIVLLLLLMIAYFIPYHEVITITAVIKTTPETVFVKAEQDGLIYIDTIQGSDTLKEVILCQLNNERVYYRKIPFKGKLLINNENNDFVNKDDDVLAIISKDVKYYAFTEINKSVSEKIKEGNKVILNTNKGRKLFGHISYIYTFPPQNKYNKIQIKIQLDQSDLKDIVPNNKLQGQIILSESSFLNKFIQSIRR